MGREVEERGGMEGMREGQQREVGEERVSRSGTDSGLGVDEMA